MRSKAFRKIKIFIELIYGTLEPNGKVATLLKQKNKEISHKIMRIK